VLETGSAVTSLKPGDRVTCSSGHATLAVVPQDRVLPVPDGVSLEDAAWVNLATMALLGPRLARIELGEPTLVIGLGPVGQLAAQMARLQGAAPVIGADVEDFRLSVAAKCGTVPLKANGPNFRDDLLGLTDGRGPAVVIEATGHPQPIVQALEAATAGGRVVLLATPRGVTESVDFCNTVHRRSLTVMGAYASRRPPRNFSPAGVSAWQGDAEVILRLLAGNLLDVAALTTHKMSIEYAPEAYRMVMEWRPDVLGVLLDHR
jgi:threonine dehydrogenase-like Zn-dependent dehydrogenase